MKKLTVKDCYLGKCKIVKNIKVVIESRKGNKRLAHIECIDASNNDKIITPSKELEDCIGKDLREELMFVNDLYYLKDFNKCLKYIYNYDEYDEDNTLEYTLNEFKHNTIEYITEYNFC